MSHPASGSGWVLQAGAPNVSTAASPPHHRPIPVGGLWGYLDPIGVRPGHQLRIHLSTPAAHRIEVLRLGRRAILNLGEDVDADRGDAVRLAGMDLRAASPQAVRPGSYAWVDAKLPRPAAISVWVRPWRLPSVGEVWAWSAVVSDLDAAGGGRWALAIDDQGRPALYLGDGDGTDHTGWLFGRPLLASRLGEWIHLACSWEVTATTITARIYVDGLLVAQRDDAPPAPHRPGGRVRIGAGVEGAVVDHFLDADLSALTLLSCPLSAHEVLRLAEDRGVSEPAALDLDTKVLTYWPLRETAGARLADAGGAGHDATIVNGATLGIPGPSASTAAGRPGYDPEHDPLRGGAVRFSCDDLDDCRWPCSAWLGIPADADSGTYCVRVTLTGGTADDALEIPFVVVRPRPRHKHAIALLYPTFTWLAYARRPAGELVVPGLASSFYTRHLNGRLFFRLGMRAPMPRAYAHLPNTHVRAATVHQHLVRPERLAEAWLAREGYAYECVTDVELHSEPDLLQDFAALMVVGHSEYWSDAMRNGLADYLAAGGAVANFSGNTLYWRVTFDAASATVEARKTSRAGEADGWLPPDEWGERWHSDGRPGGTWSLLGRPGSDLLGLDTLGWIDSGDATAFAPYVVRQHGHELLHTPETVPLGPGGTLGAVGVNGPGVSGYEMDGLPEALGMQPPDGGAGRVVLAQADRQTGYVERAVADPRHGADLIWWERPDGGRVFNAGSIAYSGALAVDPGIQALTRNVLHRFGVVRSR